MALSLDEESPEQVIRRLTRELEHVTQQCRVSHRMALFHQREWEKAEQLRARAERALKTWRKKLLDQPKDEPITHRLLDLWAIEGQTWELEERHPSLAGGGNHRPGDTVAS
jgi:hypothetical protein